MTDGPCRECDDSGFVETFHGGFWTGHAMRTTYAICDCACGDDVRRERAATPPSPSPDMDKDMKSHG